MVLRPTSSSAVTTATIHLLIQIWLFLFIPPDNLPPQKNEEGLKIFISNFASLSWRIALKCLHAFEALIQELHVSESMGAGLEIAVIYNLCDR